MTYDDIKNLENDLREGKKHFYQFGKKMEVSKWFDLFLTDGDDIDRFTYNGEKLYFNIEGKTKEGNYFNIKSTDFVASKMEIREETEETEKLENDLFIDDDFISDDFIDDDIASGYDDNMYCDTTGYCNGYSCPNYKSCHSSDSVIKNNDVDNETINNDNMIKALSESSISLLDNAIEFSQIKNKLENEEFKCSNTLKEMQKKYDELLSLYEELSKQTEKLENDLFIME